MSEDVWSERDTTPDAIETALRELLRERHRANRTLAPARVLNLVVIVDRDWKGEVANRLDRVGRYHASRTVLCAVEDGREQLDAVAVMSYEETTAGGVVAMHEKVEIDMGPQHLAGIDSIVDPVVVSELPTMLWNPHGHDEAVEELRPMIDVILLDSDDADEPVEGLARAHDLAQGAYVVDLAWLRTTPWRERLAASFDPLDRLRKLRSLDAVTIRHRSTSRASALLLSGWLASRLQWEVEPMGATNGTARGAARGAEGGVHVELDAIEQDAPGLAGVTVSCAGGFTLSLDRGRGGLAACEQEPGGEMRKWRVLGASRGEGGILGEGVRQALLRDPTYGPALDAARRFADGI
jgi:glucose-6-phosphate dehydrogenase assembly protein OpcA